MPTVKTIVDKIRDLLYQLCPTGTFYLQELPPAVARPSFHIYLDSDRSEDGGRLLTNETTIIGVKYYAPLEGTVPEELKPLSVYCGAKDIFRKGNIQADGRSLKVILVRGGTQNSEMYLLVKLVYCEDRPHEEPVYELMGEVRMMNEVIIK